MTVRTLKILRGEMSVEIISLLQKEKKNVRFTTSIQQPLT
jgi:hypothetical protein